MTLVIFLGALFSGMALGMPIAFALLLSGICLMFYLDIFSTQIIAQNVIQAANDFSLMAIPFFILAGELMNAGGISKRIVTFAMTLVGHVRGGLGYVTIIASVLFAGLSGSAVADTAALGAILIPMMIKAGYDKKRAIALVPSSGIIACIIPPSIPMIIFGVTSGVSITQLFMAGIVPGIMMAGGLAIAWWLITRKDTNIEVLPKRTKKEVLSATKQAIWALLLPVILICGLRFGVFTPTEGGAVAAFYALFVGVFVYRELEIKNLYELLKNSARTTSIVMFLASGSLVAAWLIALANIPGTITDLIGPLVENKLLLLIVINILVLLVGTAMDLLPTVLILTPVLMPVVTAAGIDPVYFGLLFVINISIGLITPPVGSVLNVACGIGKINMEDITKGLMPFFLVQIIVLLLLILFPQIVTIPVEWMTD
ncbi:TRAP transporter large permease [Metabacillus arenae]|uniref:TRAP transporter large permease subunit n=1 Tax=Metabacillus arenae TaxID=2771434 RepID=A0A926NIN9_9BACI|nr:TRAP transporter large permease subunit [Metabacillus arenae]MBD1382419.1 TRAP transporter large permease subunit [Metabacillus arenae]